MCWHDSTRTTLDGGGRSACLRRECLLGNGHTPAGRFFPAGLAAWIRRIRLLAGREPWSVRLDSRQQIALCESPGRAEIYRLRPLLGAPSFVRPPRNFAAGPGPEWPAKMNGPHGIGKQLGLQVPTRLDWAVKHEARLRGDFCTTEPLGFRQNLTRTPRGFRRVVDGGQQTYRPLVKTARGLILNSKHTTGKAVTHEKGNVDQRLAKRRNSHCDC